MALLMTASRPACSRAKLSATSSSSARVDTSARKDDACPPAPRICSATWLQLDASMSTSPTAAPWRPSAMAIARPRPRPAPVINTAWSEISAMGNTSTSVVTDLQRAVESVDEARSAGAIRAYCMHLVRCVGEPHLRIRIGKPYGAADAMVAECPWVGAHVHRVRRVQQYPQRLVIRSILHHLGDV